VKLNQSQQGYQRSREPLLLKRNPDATLCESFFATLECELLDRSTFRTQEEAKLTIFCFIEGWYNPHRLHSALGYESPVSYERRQSAVLEQAA
jgi:putative transposase